MSSIKIHLDENLKESVNSQITELNNQKIIERIWNKDFTVWNEQPDEISNRLGWLDCPEVTAKSIDEINTFVNEIRSEGFTNALLFGMGGSSLAPEVFSLTFGLKKGYLNLSVLDCTHPERVLELREKLKPEKTLYIVSTKSGGTIETISFMKYFYNFFLNKLGEEKVGNHIIAITDPGSGLEQMAINLKFRKIFLNDPNIGGRFSALSLFGIVPAALIGIDISRLLDKAKVALVESKSDVLNLSSINTAALIGILMGAFYKEGRNKLTIILSEKMKSLGSWMEQLIAESTGKNGKGILPIDGEDLLEPEFYRSDRYFVSIKLKDERENEKIKKIIDFGVPVIELELDDEYRLAEQFFNWEFATALAGSLINIHPFDQPDVESAKVRAKEMIKEYDENGELPKLHHAFVDDNIKVYGDVKSTNIKEAIDEFLSSAEEGGYVTIQAFLKPDERLFNDIQEFRTKILKKYKIATTFGWGPRFLHSTGQLHKGDEGKGLFIQIISDHESDTPIPVDAKSDNSKFSFATLIDAQALGDRQALLDKGRKVLRIQLESATAIEKLSESI